MMIDLNQHLMMPSPWGMANGTTFALSNYGLTASGHKAAIVFAAPKDGVIEEVGLMIGSVTAGATLDLRVETIDANGDPSGTLVAAGASVNLVVAGGDANTWKSATLGTPVAVTRGQMIAFVADNTPSAGNLNVRNSAVAPQQRGYSDVFAASWTKQTSAMCSGVRYQGDTLWARILGVIPATNMGFASWNDATNPDERGIRVITPFGGRIVGVWMFSVTVALTGDGNVNLYRDDGSVVQASAFPGVQRSNTNSSGRTIHWFDQPVYSDRGEVIRVAVKATNASNNLGFNFVDVANAAVRGALEMGSQISYTTRNAGGAWTDSDTTMPWMGLIYDQIETHHSPYTRAFSRRSLRSRA